MPEDSFNKPSTAGSTRCSRCRPSPSQKIPPQNYRHGTHLSTSSLKSRSQPFPYFLPPPLPHPLLGRRPHHPTLPTHHDKSFGRYRNHDPHYTPAKLPGDHASPREGSKELQRIVLLLISFGNFFLSNLSLSFYLFPYYYYYTRVSYVHFHPQPAPLRPCSAFLSTAFLTFPAFFFRGRVLK